MASSFSARQYFKNIQKPELLTQYYATHGITAIFDVEESTPKRVIALMLHDFYKGLEPEKKFEIERELALLDSISIKHTPGLFVALLKEKNLPHEVTQIECETIHDKVLYYYLYNKDLVEEVLFFVDFYTTRGYMTTEAKEVPVADAEYAVTELTREFTRIANKNDRVTECDVTAQTLDGLLYVQAVFEGAPNVSPSIDKETGEVDRKRTVRKLERIHIVYFPNDKEAIISYTGGKEEKLIFLDAFLRIACGGGYEDKVESYDLSVCKNPTFNFPQSDGLVSWKVKTVTFAFGIDKKKKMRLSLPSSVQEQGMAPLMTSIRELGFEQRFGSFVVEQIAFSFSFVNREKPESGIIVPCSVTSLKSSLCPLFPYDRLARTMLKQAGIYEGFIELEKKEEKGEKEDAGVSDF